MRFNLFGFKGELLLDKKNKNSKKKKKQEEAEEEKKAVCVKFTMHSEFGESSTRFRKQTSIEPEAPARKRPVTMNGDALFAAPSDVANSSSSYRADNVSSNNNNSVARTSEGFNDEDDHENEPVAATSIPFNWCGTPVPSSTKPIPPEGISVDDDEEDDSSAPSPPSSRPPSLEAAKAEMLQKELSSIQQREKETERRNPNGPTNVTDDDVTLRSSPKTPSPSHYRHAKSIPHNIKPHDVVKEKKRPARPSAANIFASNASDKTVETIGNDRRGDEDTSDDDDDDSDVDVLNRNKYLEHESNFKFISDDDSDPGYEHIQHNEGGKPKEEKEGVKSQTKGKNFEEEPKADERNKVNRQSSNYGGYSDQAANIFFRSNSPVPEQRVRKFKFADVDDGDGDDLSQTSA